MKQLNIMQIQELIPHRHPFLLIDGIEDYEPGEYAAINVLHTGKIFLPDIFRRSL